MATILASAALEQGWEDLLHKGLVSKQFRLCGPHGLCYPSSAAVVAKSRRRSPRGVGVAVCQELVTKTRGRLDLARSP